MEITQEIREEFTKLADLASAVVAIDDDNRIIFVDDGMCEMSGYTHEQLLGSLLKETLIPLNHIETHDNYIKEFRDSTETGRHLGSTGTTLRLRRSNGVELPVDIRIAVVLGYCVAVIEQVTEDGGAFMPSHACEMLLKYHRTQAMADKYINEGLAIIDKLNARVDDLEKLLTNKPLYSLPRCTSWNMGEGEGKKYFYWGKTRVAMLAPDDCEIVCMQLAIEPKISAGLVTIGIEINDQDIAKFELDRSSRTSNLYDLEPRPCKKGDRIRVYSFEQGTLLPDSVDMDSVIYVR